MQSNQKLRVLIVDDSISVRSVLRTLLNENGYNVVGEQGSGSKLLNSIKHLMPHIICLDYYLPGTDGLSLLKKIQDVYPHIAVVMITGSNDQKLEHAAADAGSAGFLHKPFTQEQIIKALQKVAYAQRLLLVAEKKRNPFAEKPSRATAVVADDSVTLRRLLSAILAHMGVEVVAEACDGKQAIELVCEHRPDIVCLDYEMPVMNGLEALKIIHKQTPTIKAVMVTSTASRDKFIQATQAGAKSYILKPYHPDKVTHAISKLLAS